MKPFYFLSCLFTFQQTRAEWQVVFYISSAIYTFGAIIYMIFASGVIQKWACDEDELKPEVVELRSNDFRKKANEC